MWLGGLGFVDGGVVDKGGVGFGFVWERVFMISRIGGAGWLFQVRGQSGRELVKEVILDGKVPSPFGSCRVTE